MRRTWMAVLGLVVACGDDVTADLHEVVSVRSQPNRDLDLLFVIDNSSSMTEKQRSLAAAFPAMLDILGQVDGGIPNLHVGVVTSDMGASGSGSPTPGPSVGTPGAGGCAGFGDDGALQQLAGMTEPFLSDLANPDGSRITNYTGTLADTLGALVEVGAGGCGFEQHLAAMRRGLANPANAGFLRPSANLAVVILADEDDCSLFDPSLEGPTSNELGRQSSFRCFAKGVSCSPDSTSAGLKTDCTPSVSSSYVEYVAPFVSSLLALKPDPRMVMVGAIVGDPTPVAVELRPISGGGTEPALAHSCGAGAQVADPAVRLAAFLDAFPERSVLGSICNANLAAPLGRLGQTAKQMIGDPCLTAGVVEPTCEVYDVRDSAPTTETDVPRCGGGDPTCFELIADPAGCPATSDHLRLRVTRPSPAPDDAWTHVRCELAP